MFVALSIRYAVILFWLANAFYEITVISWRFARKGRRYVFAFIVRKVRMALSFSPRNGSRRTKESDFPSRARPLGSRNDDSRRAFLSVRSTPPIISSSLRRLRRGHKAAFDFYETCNSRGDKEFSVVARMRRALGAALRLAISFSLKIRAQRSLV